jgi:hypothetical protein
MVFRRNSAARIAVSPRQPSSARLTRSVRKARSEATANLAPTSSHFVENQLAHPTGVEPVTFAFGGPGLSDYFSDVGNGLALITQRFPWV